MAQNKSSLELGEFQSTEVRSLYRAINELRIAKGLLPVDHSNSMEDQVYDRTILVKIHDLKYSISSRELDMVFSRFGAVEQVEILSFNSQFHSRVCFQHIDSARRAFAFLNHRCVYDYCCRLELFLMREIMIEPSTVIKDSLNDENGCNAGNVGIQEVGSVDSSLQETQNSSGIQDLESFDLSVQGTQGNNSIDVFEDLEISGDSTEPEEMMVSHDILLDSMEIGVDILIKMPTREVVVKTRPVNEKTDDPIPEIDKDVEEIQLPDASLKVNSDSVEAIVYDMAFDEMGEFTLVSDIIESDEMAGIVDESLDSMEIMGQGIRVFDPGDADPECYGFTYVQMGMEKCGYGTSLLEPRLMPFDRGRSQALHSCPLHKDFSWEMQDYVLVFDPGIAEGLSYMSNGLSKQVEQASLKWEDYGLKLYLGSHCIGWKIVPRYFAQRFDVGLRDLGESPHYSNDLCAGNISVFDPGGLLDQGRVELNSSHATVLVHGCWVIDGLILVWDPGGSYMSVFFELETMIEVLGSVSKWTSIVSFDIERRKVNVQVRTQWHSHNPIIFLVGNSCCRRVLLQWLIKELETIISTIQ